MKKIIKPAIAAMLAAAAMACGNSNSGWGVDGSIEGLDGGKIALERFNNGRWLVVDSITPKADGSFKYNAEAASLYPEIMRLSLDGNCIYFPIDSVDHITVVASAKEFSAGKVSGSVQALRMQAVDSLLQATIAQHGAEYAVTDSLTKRELFKIAHSDPSVVTLYYLVNKTVGGRQLFDLAQPFDLRLYTAVAQRFNTEIPDDPRTAYLTERAARARQALNPTTTELIVPSTGLFELERFDARGQKQSLAAMAAQGGVTLLSFTSYNIESSPAYNIILNDLWEKYHEKGLNIYQISFDADEASWRQRALNLPWTAVWNANTDGNEALIKYNVGALPMTFVINRQGEIVERVIDPDQLATMVAKYI